MPYNGPNHASHTRNYSRYVETVVRFSFEELLFLGIERSTGN
jgi:hypothetical protein